MTSPLFFVEDDQLSELNGQPGSVQLDAASSKHAIGSMRLDAGDEVLIADGRGTIGSGSVSVANAQAAEVSLSEVWREEQPVPSINLVQALAKGDRDLMGAAMATEIGVDEVTPWQAERSIVRLHAKKQDKAMAKWAANLKASAQQARRSRIPVLHEPITGARIDQLHNPDEGAIAVVLHEDATTTLDETAGELEQAQKISLIVGPEGGISPAEITAMEQARAPIIRLGTHVMRSSTAGSVALSLVLEKLGRWR